MKKYQVEYPARAEQDLKEIIIYLDTMYGEMTAKKYGGLFNEATKKLEQFSLGMAVVEGLAKDLGEIRRVHIKRYAMYYKVDEQRSLVKIVRIGHGLMDVSKLLG